MPFNFPFWSRRLLSSSEHHLVLRHSVQWPTIAACDVVEKGGASDVLLEFPVPLLFLLPPAWVPADLPLGGEGPHPGGPQPLSLSV